MFLSTINKQPWLAVNLSLFFPGLGQIYAGKYIRGLSLVIVQAASMAIAFWSIYSSQGNTVTALLFIFLLIVVYLANLFDAYYCVPKLPTYLARKGSRNQIKDPWYALFLSRILPGLGHLYLKKSLFAVILLTVTIAIALVDHVSDYLLIFLPIITAFSAYHVYFAVSKNSFKTEPNIYNSQVFLKSIALLILFLGIINSYLPNIIETQIEPFIIPSTSMLPTLQVKDRVLVRKIRNYKPQPGEIVVFKPTRSARKLEIEANSKPADFFIKRVIAIPNQIIKVEGGVVYLDGKPIQEDYINEPTNYYLPATIVPAHSYCNWRIVCGWHNAFLQF